MLKTGPSMLRNIIGPIFNTRIGSFVVHFLFFEYSSSFCRENEIFENKKQKHKNNLDQFLKLEKDNLDQFLTLQHIYIYMDAVVLLSGPKFAFL